MNGTKFLLSINETKIKLGLQRTKELLAVCSNPQNKVYSIQIAGTNGKGTTSAMIAQTLNHHKLKVGHFTSPHLVDLKERIKINNKYISKQYIDLFIKKHKSEINDIGASFFEIISVMAIKYFYDNNVDVAILETGLGGKFDSITAMNAEGLIYTAISMDHMHILGNTLDLIAKEKAGAITKQTKWILSTIQDNAVAKILDKKAKQNHHTVNYIHHYEEFSNQDQCKYLPGKHQIYNANLALAATKIIWEKKSDRKTQLSNPAFILETYWPGRIQKLQTSPDILFDVAHNVSGIKAFISYFKEIKSQYNKKYLIIGFESQKPIFDIINNLISYFDYTIITETNIRSSMPAKMIYKNIIKKSNIAIDTNPYNAINTLSDELSKQDILIIIGSHYFGNVLNKIFKNCFGNKIKA
jgi:dihydrofolate synthase/folylpolyglutamate synthase